MAPVAFEVSWNIPDEVLRKRGGGQAVLSEAAPLLKKTLDDSAEWLESTDDPAEALAGCCDDFRPRTIQSFHVLGWLILQLTGILYQATLLSELSQHLALFDETVAAQCNPEHMRWDFCLGPDWKVAFSDVLNIKPSPGRIAEDADFDVVVPENALFGPFTTVSVPSTFVVAVEPQASAENVAWKVTLKPERCLARAQVFEGTGTAYELPEHAYCFTNTSWNGILNVQCPDSSVTSVRVTIVDSGVKHFLEIHRQEQCNFRKSFRNFNAQHLGHHHTVLAYTASAIRIFLVLSVCMVGLLLHRFCAAASSGALLRRLIIWKLLLHDFPQQFCIVAYLYGWYGTDGLRCQLCLFHPTHCDEETALHGMNLMACLLTALSASSNQLLVKAQAKSSFATEDWIILAFFRFGLFAASTVPFSTALYVSPFWFHFDSVSRLILMLFVAGVPLISGWGFLCCGWIFIVFHDDIFEL